MMLLLSLITLIPLIKGTLCTKLKGITPGIIIGAGRIGQHLFDSNGGVDQLMKDRNQCIPPDTEGPIYVCTRNEDLEEIINSTPAHRLPDLVFLQNGMIKDYLESKGLGKNTKALIYYAIAKKGDPPIDGKTSVNPEGLTSITGKWADDFAARLANAGLACHILDPTDWEVAMFEKLIWISAYMAVGARHKCSVGEVETLHNVEVRLLIRELVEAVSKTHNIQFRSGVEDRLGAYATSVGHYPAAIKEYQWRSGWFVSLSETQLILSGDDPCPTHSYFMKELGF